MTNENFIKAQLAALAHREGHEHGGTNNMLAVAFVMRNRQRAGWRGGEWLGIIHTAEEVASRISEVSAPDLRDINFRILLQQIDDVYSGMAADKITEGALYYAELNRIESTWFRKHILDDLEHHPRVANVGNVVFFK